jgi:hypothetical protein
MERARYLIVCATQENYSITKKVLMNFPDLLIEMNNYDGTSDFIIECTESSANLLKEQGLELTSDRVIRYDL